MNRPGLIGTLFAAAGVSGVALALACGPATPAAQTALNTVPADVSLGLCILNVDETDTAKGLPALTVIADATAQCAASLVQILNTIEVGTARDLVVGRVTVDQANAKIAPYYSAAKLAPPRPIALADLHRGAGR